MPNRGPKSEQSIVVRHGLMSLVVVAWLFLQYVSYVKNSENAIESKAHRDRSHRALLARQEWMRQVEERPAVMGLPTEGIDWEASKASDE